MAHLNQFDRYLEASKGWAPLAIGKDWVGTKYLGGGTYGMACLFEYQGDNPDVSPRKIVVKQEGDDGVNLKQESRILQRLMEYESDHIIKIYKAWHRTMGAGTDPGKDPSIVDHTWKRSFRKQLADRVNDVSRIYIEYGSHGDLEGWMDDHCTATHPSEEYVWRLWECLLKGLMILKHGTENWRDDLSEEGAKLWHTPVGHFDLKAANTSATIPDQAMTLADFGLALEIPDPRELERDPEKLKAWMKIAEFRNSFLAPEQNFIDHPNRIIGTAVDLWNISHIVYMCLNETESIPKNELFTIGVDPVPSLTFKTMGIRLLDPDRVIYSRKLRGVLLRGLAVDPNERWNVEDLLQIVQEVLEHWNFGDDTDLFMEGIQSELDEWKGEVYPALSQDPDSEKGMKVRRFKRMGVFNPLGVYNPVDWNDQEDEYDYGAVKLLFPTHKAVQMGHRDMPFEKGVAEKPPPRFPDWSGVGKDGKRKRDPDDKDEEDEDDTKATASGSGRPMPKPLAGAKRMRTAQEQEGGEITDSPRTSGSDPTSSSQSTSSQQSRKKRQRTTSPRKAPSPELGGGAAKPRLPQRSPFKRRGYVRDDEGELVWRTLPTQPRDDEDENDVERSAPWIPDDPIKDVDFYNDEV
ncbi:hypothetical protein SBOR_6032 [Sclerotinia borealis F-4128]|uniref:non-specific serine/threonine protein kinase n=1 Tax=Sclerotinia borealis (strain F-4128) TaxID=1432307 RepID=W9CCP7_SCLBF|nr:hypothetical protein SBOR_6032 [Sclerotinia borealis F-4128]